MPPQSVEVAETIAALKRALRREKEAPSDKQITSATNRGNKLKKGASYVHAGSLPFTFTQHGYKERIEHAGYQRYILDRRPRRFNEYGDELDDSESDAEADADAEDGDPYGDIKLEELLRPLTHPAELDAHPSLSQAYLDPALPDMLLTTEEKLRQERASLWRAKSLHRYFIGDESWVPSEKVEQLEDWDLFDPVIHEVPRLSPGKKRKRDMDIAVATNGVAVQELVENELDGDIMQVDATTTNGKADTKVDAAGEQAEHGEELDTTKEETQGNMGNDGNDVAKGEEIEVNGMHLDKRGSDTLSSETAVDTESALPAADTNTNGDTTTNGHDQRNEDGADADAEESPPPPSRRITRALAATNTSNTATPPLSPISSITSTVDSILFQPHPIFLLPPSIQIPHTTHQASNLPLHVAHSGLPVDEILETRRLLGMYIQKQEETIRGLESVMAKLIKAKRMRDQVWEWCKAEGHQGEWSDGEDWVDVDAWGIAPNELRKGRDEETIEEEEIGRKGKRRRARERD